MNSNNLNLEKFFLSFIASRTCKCSCKVQSCISIKLTGFILFKLPLFFFGNSDKLVGAQALPPEFFNILATVFEGSKALSKVYTNKDIQNIICAVIKARPVAAKSPY